VRNLSIAGALALTLAAPLVAQNTRDRSLTASELTRQIESLGGEDVTKSPFGLSPATGSAPKENIFSPSAPGADPSKDKKGPPPKKEKGPTVITALEATFDNRTHEAVFIGKVVVVDPEFNVTCDKLTAFLKHEEKPPANGAPSPSTPAPVNATGKPKPTTPRATPVPNLDEAGAKPAAKKGGGLERAIAEGSVVIMQDKIEPDGTVTKSIGHAKKAVYDAATGDIVLTGRPEVQQGMSTIIATDESTVMTFNRDGQMRAKGPHKTTLVDQKDKGQ
jgi:lipopolysaccharide export system protein LptA